MHVALLNLATCLTRNSCAVPANGAALQAVFRVMVWNANCAETRSCPIDTGAVAVVYACLSGRVRPGTPPVGKFPTPVLEMFRVTLLPALPRLLRGCKPDQAALLAAMFAAVLTANPSVVMDVAVSMLPQLLSCPDFVVPLADGALLAATQLPAYLEGACAWIQSAQGSNVPMSTLTADFTPSSKLSGETTDDRKDALRKEVASRPSVQGMFCVMLAYALRFEAPPLDPIGTDGERVEPQWDAPAAGALWVSLSVLLRLPHREKRPMVVSMLGALVHRTVSMCEDAYRRAAVPIPLLRCALDCTSLVMRHLPPQKLGGLSDHVRQYFHDGSLRPGVSVEEPTLTLAVALLPTALQAICTIENLLLDLQQLFSAAGTKSAPDTAPSPSSTLSCTSLLSMLFSGFTASANAYVFCVECNLVRFATTVSFFLQRYGEHRCSIAPRRIRPRLLSGVGTCCQHH